MAQQYWIGGFYIDLSRNQITQNNESKTLAPKALSVLTYLAQNQGKVISQDELLDNVWQGSVVSLNTLQRSIAQLRKALGDDGKVQVYIKTHAKQGYSLECDVRWQQEISSGNDTKNPSDEVSIEEPNVEASTASKPTFLTSHFSLIAFAIAIMICGLIVAQLFVSEQTAKLKVGELRALTATDNREVAGIYSPDGKYIVFHRYSDEFCSNNIWAKNIETQQEFQLTKNLNSYGAHSFSKDGKSLVFVQSKTCTEPVNQKICYHLMSLDFEKALKLPQTPELLLACKNSQIRKPQWLNNNNIALLQKSSQRWKLISYSITDNKSDTLYQVVDGNLIDYDYSVKDDLIALISIQGDGHYYIEILKPSGQLVSSHRINYPQEIAPFKFIYPNFSPFENQLIFSTGRQLFTLSYDGQVSNISLPIDEPMGSPVFHPDSNRMLAIKGQYDSDIVSVPLEHLKTGKTQNQSLAVLERSIREEGNALFQPNGDLIAFKSARSGQMQIWLTDGKVPKQLSHFPLDTFLYEIHWAMDGNSLLANADEELSQHFLDGTTKTYTFEYPVNKLFYWDSENKTALSLVRIKGVLTFAELNFANSTTSVINDNQVTWALKTKDDRTIYTDHMDRFWQSGPVEDQIIEVLKTQGSNKQFVISGNTIYGINEDFQLWSYAVNEGIFAIIGDVPKNIDYITDVNATQLLMTLRVIARKEVVELLLAN